MRPFYYRWHLGGFQVGAIINDASMNILVLIFCCTFVWNSVGWYWQAFDFNRHCQTIFWVSNLYSSCNVKRALVSLHLMLTVDILILFSFRHSCGCIVVLMVVLNCISHVLWGAIGQRVRLTSWMSLETNEIELLFISLLSIWIFSFVKCLFQAFCLFFFHWIVRQFVICRSSIYILIWVPFSDICIAKVFSPIHWLTFSFT